MSSDTLRASPDLTEDSGLPVTDRKTTDVFFSRLLAVFFIFLVVSIIVGGTLGDIRYVSHGYDDSGNFCGLPNQRILGVYHSGADMTQKRFLEISVDELRRPERKCVETCRNGRDSSIVPRCRRTEERSEHEMEVSIVEAACFYTMLFWKEILALCFLSMCLCGLVLTLLKFYPLVVLWTLLPVTFVAGVVSTTCFWISFSSKVQSSKNNIDGGHSRKDISIGWTLSGSMVTAFTVVFFMIVIYHRNKMKLMATLFEECGRCITTMPALLLQPFQTLLSMAVLFCFLGVGLVCLDMPGQLVTDRRGRLTLKIHVFFQVTAWLLLFGCLWISQFLLGCQNMIVSGAVAQWYFTRIKANLVKPVKRSFCTLFQYHLGSVAFGSVILSIVKAFQIVSEIGKKGSGYRSVLCFAIFWLLHCALYFLEFMTKNAYAMIALYGESFCNCARLSYALLSANGYRVAAAEGVCGLFLGLVNLLAASICAALGSLIFKSVGEEVWIPVGMVLLLSFLCCHCLTSVYDMTIDSFLLCFCIDCTENDGITKPYYMGKRLEILLTDTEGNPVELSNKTETTPTQASV